MKCGTMKTSLWQKSGKITLSGDSERSELLGQAWRKTAEELSPELTHNLHEYPARIQPSLVRFLLKELKPTSVYDPFCGSGTTLVEAAIANIPSVGSDLNMIGLRLSDIKTRKWNRDDIEFFESSFQKIAERNFEKIAERVNVRADLPRHEIQWYAPHNLRELASLWEEIHQEDYQQEVDALEMLFSSIVTKVSFQVSATSEKNEPNKIRKGLPTEFFERKGQEWIKAFAQFSSRCKNLPQGFLGDATQKRTWTRAGSELERNPMVLTSPPYGGIYDYVSHHKRREAWLGIRNEKLSKYEIGAKRHAREEGAIDDWNNQTHAYLTGIESILETSPAILVIGDAYIEGERIDAIEHLEHILPATKLSIIAAASQRRGERHEKHRKEHLVWLERTS